MKNLILGFILLTGYLNALVYEDALDGTTSGWSVYDNSPSGATISNVSDPAKDRAISLSGSGLSNGYRFDLQHTTNTTLQWDMKFNEHFTVFVLVKTQNNGLRFLIYNDVLDDGSANPIGLGVDASDNSWHTFSRDLNADLLARYGDATDSVVTVDAFMVRGSGLITNISSSVGTIIEDAEDNLTMGWSVYDNLPSGATISNVTDVEQGQVIELSGSGIYNGYMLGHWGSNGFKLENKNLSWKMKYDEMFSVYIIVKTEDGNRYLWYTAEDSDRGVQLGGRYIHHGLGADAIDGQWHTFSRDLESDLQEYLPDLNVLGINAFLVRGSGRIDDIQAF